MSIYVWKLGEVALAKICKKVYAKVTVVKNEEGLFHDEKVLAISPSKDGTISTTEELCYYVEISRTGQRLWLPYTSLHLAARSRPFYGTDKVVASKPAKTDKPAVTRKRKIKEDYTLPMDVKLTKFQKDPDLNITYDHRHIPLKQGKYENSFNEFVRRGKEMLFDHFYDMLERDSETNYDVLDYVRNVDASTEDKFEEVIKHVVTEKEIESYLNQCWRFNIIHKQQAQMDYKEKENLENSSNGSPEKAPVPVHTTWCLVCGGSARGGAVGGRLRACPACPAAFHAACRREWLVTVIHRKNPPQKPAKPTTLVTKILSSTRAVSAVRREQENMELCPSCMWGPKVGYDDVVWHKLGACAWWPARVLRPGGAPPRLLAAAHKPSHWPLRYYGTLNHAWGESNRMCLFLPSHIAALTTARDPMLQQAVLDACDDYIAVYLT